MAKSGEITALMGPSGIKTYIDYKLGAGKTTFLACLSQRIAINKHSKLLG